MSFYMKNLGKLETEAVREELYDTAKTINDQRRWLLSNFESKHFTEKERESILGKKSEAGKVTKQRKKSGTGGLVAAGAVAVAATTHALTNT